MALNKPARTREEVEALLKNQGVDLKKEKFALVGIRKKGNKVGVWDDDFIIIGEKQFFTFNGNTDPSREYPNVANLKPGVWRYKKGTHGSKAYGPYPAFRQAAPVTVMRYIDGKTWKPDTGNFGINIHHGSKRSESTSSIGCQTVRYVDWEAFKNTIYMMLTRYEKADFAYVLIQE